jgi:leucyl/phenylalanyl-tRNA---protein transferase
MLTPEHGIVAVGGDCSVERLLLAYKLGIFPWPDDEVLLWYCPTHRMVLQPHEVYISKSMKTVLKKNTFEFRYNTHFDEVIASCALISRPDQPGTWINKEIINGYTSLHKLGYTISAEAWYNNELVGGLYGVRMGQLFCGESMFSKMENASKFAFIMLCQLFSNTKEVSFIDCQVYTAHLASLGAYEIERAAYINIINKLTSIK